MLCYFIRFLVISKSSLFLKILKIVFGQFSKTSSVLGTFFSLNKAYYL
jgi:hypothetical protein